ncbi:tetratricopeptide repeat protein [Methyloraptor flagellatus]|uniref:Tetratricopeptide repeat protein n=1 Tax=Methyloraptor flagellatus TaxID=3162530 RepID=A0AAU7X5F9_9HYPH
MNVRALAQTAIAAREALESSAKHGDDVAGAILRLDPDWAIYDHAQDWLPGLADTVWNSVEQTARSEMAVGHADRAISLLVPFVADETTRGAALRRLAQTSAEMARYEEALIIVRRCLEDDPNDPQMLCLAGLCRYKLGDNDGAQVLLAKSARIARKFPEYAESLRAAQRLLLQIHFG